MSAKNEEIDNQKPVNFRMFYLYRSGSVGKMAGMGFVACDCGTKTTDLLNCKVKNKHVFNLNGGQ